MKLITTTHDGRRFTLTTLIHPITILKGVIRRCRSHIEKAPATLKVGGGAKAPPNTHRQDGDDLANVSKTIVGLSSNSLGLKSRADVMIQRDARVCTHTRTQTYSMLVIQE